ncbi:capsule polysaccharide biosynthesis protein [Dactylonectria macrodidyma]|uniref:Capsule polysaccharide biosynthesis protein n=1 Tax=Dactylonectria macrodidyma TaxID=307937 RepID=A0A9P9DBU5_9HYPO|nr:capsule polysaccharide biosynthesis protein [Dactylonectria macrodidyma]
MTYGANRNSATAALEHISTPVIIGGIGYLLWKTEWRDLMTAFMELGRTSRILLLLVIFTNWKSLPFMWTCRIFSVVFYHNYVRKSPILGPRALFKPMISETHSPLLEIDYNFHKSNSTFFSDLDISRAHLISYLCRPALRHMAQNVRSRLVLDPKTGAPVKGSLGVLLGAVECSFKKEVAPYKAYEMWSNILCWDRKWLFIVTHFVPKGTTRPTEWLDPNFAQVKTWSHSDTADNWKTKIIATAISKYVFKIGRFTVHPALILADSGMLPERPGGWMSGEKKVGDGLVCVNDVDLSVESEWDWRRIEAQRRKGMELACHLHALEEADELFDGGSRGALARVWPG